MLTRNLYIFFHWLMKLKLSLSSTQQVPGFNPPGTRFQPTRHQISTTRYQISTHQTPGFNPPGTRFQPTRYRDFNPQGTRFQPPDFNTPGTKFVTILTKFTQNALELSSNGQFVRSICKVFRYSETRCEGR